MRILFIGDIVGSLGRKALKTYLPQLKQKYHPQVTIVNGENAAGGRGITEKIYKEFLQNGVDVITMGNHTWDNRDIFEFIDDAQKLLRPANFPAGTPGVGLRFFKVNQAVLAVINLQARSFMAPLDDPFAAAEQLIQQALEKTPLIFIDFHGETTSEKLAMAWFLDGRVSALIGTHTHVQTSDARILPEGTGYLTDAGMTGPRDGILGMKKESVIERFRTQLPHRFEVVESGVMQLNGAFIELDTATGKCQKIETIHWEDDPLSDEKGDEYGW
ncbi:TIGR00282 family metallophosphoesterase [Enterococcus hirae]|nr:TIGR00282 family metallophosphoesterase [Enterococcaceae bacterium]MDM8214211.1 TIGR00282 family metallophosphoesterase [Enterococcus hirae]